MRIHAFFKDFLTVNGPTFIDDYWPGIYEASLYNILKKNPLKKSINYLAVPWAVLIKKDILWTLPNIKLNGFTVCYYLDTVTLCGNRKLKTFSKLKQMGINCVFSPAASLDETEFMGIHIEPLPYIPINGVKPSNNKDIFYSFIGQGRQSCRRKIFSMKHPKNTVIKKRKRYFGDLERSREFYRELKEYKNILARSRFSLCPRGQQPNSIRFWESLQAGAIPVLISDSARLPEYFDWNSCTIRVSEDNVEKIPEILNKISFEKEKEMRKNCLKAHKLFSGENLVNEIRKYYNDVA